MSITFDNFDYDTFDPTAAPTDFTLPPEGNYNFIIASIEDGKAKDGYRVIYIHSEVADGIQKGAKVRMSYGIGNPKVNPKTGMEDAAKFAKESLARFYYNITGQRLTARGINEADLRYKKFNADLEIKPSQDGKGQGFPNLKNVTVGAVAPVTASPAPVGAPAWAAR